MASPFHYISQRRSHICLGLGPYTVADSEGGIHPVLVREENTKTRLYQAYALSVHVSSFTVASFNSYIGNYRGVSNHTIFN